MLHGMAHPLAERRLRGANGGDRAPPAAAQRRAEGMRRDRRRARQARWSHPRLELWLPAEPALGIWSSTAVPACSPHLDLAPPENWPRVAQRREHDSPDPRRLDEDTGRRGVRAAVLPAAREGPDGSRATRRCGGSRAGRTRGGVGDRLFAVEPFQHRVYSRPRRQVPLGRLRRAGAYGRAHRWRREPCPA